MRNQPMAPQPEIVPVSDEGALREGNDSLPLVDPAVLLDMGEKLNSPAIAHGFAHDYAAMWDLRRSRLAAALDRRDYPAALDAVISLKVSSAMVGGLRLARLAEELEQAIRREDMSAGLALMRTVTEHGHETVDELRLSYVPEATST